MPSQLQTQVREEMPRCLVPEGTFLRVLDGFFEGLEFPMERDWVVIGRGRGADFVVPEPTISRAHAAVGYDERGFYVHDLGSTNGTLLNGEQASQEILQNGDEIQMGKLRLGVVLPKESKLGEEK